MTDKNNELQEFEEKLRTLYREDKVGFEDIVSETFGEYLKIMPRETSVFPINRSVMNGRKEIDIEWLRKIQNDVSKVLICLKIIGRLDKDAQCMKSVIRLFNELNQFVTNNHSTEQNILSYPLLLSVYSLCISSLRYNNDKYIVDIFNEGIFKQEENNFSILKLSPQHIFINSTMNADTDKVSAVKYIYRVVYSIIGKNYVDEQDFKLYFEYFQLLYALTMFNRYKSLGIIIGLFYGRVVFGNPNDYLDKYFLNQIQCNNGFIKALLNITQDDEIIRLYKEYMKILHSV